MIGTNIIVVISSAALSRSFSVAGPTVWNSLPNELRDQGCTESTFKQSLKTSFCAALVWTAC